MNFPLLSTKDMAVLSDAIFYMYVDELKQICSHLDLPITGKKYDLIHRILTFIQTGNIVQLKPIPAASKAQKNKEYPLAPATLILYGNYKNDLKTRNFFKSLIGNHFHFTAFGQDWIKERWMQATPPTYQEFASFWQQEYTSRKKTKAPLKPEWALLNFFQRYLQQHPHATKDDLHHEWEKLRTHKAHIAQKILDRILGS